MERDRAEAKRQRLEEVTETEITPAATRKPTFFEGILPGGVKRGSTVTVTPEQRRTATTFRKPEIGLATPETAPTATTPKVEPTVIIAPHSQLKSIWSQLDEVTQIAISEALKKQKPKDRPAWIKKLKAELKTKGLIK